MSPPIPCCLHATSHWAESSTRIRLVYRTTDNEHFRFERRARLECPRLLLFVRIVVYFEVLVQQLILIRVMKEMVAVFAKEAWTRRSECIVESHFLRTVDVANSAFPESQLRYKLQDRIYSRILNIIGMDHTQITKYHGVFTIPLPDQPCHCD